MGKTHARVQDRLSRSTKAMQYLAIAPAGIGRPPLLDETARRATYDPSSDNGSNQLRLRQQKTNEGLSTPGQIRGYQGLANGAWSSCISDPCGQLARVRFSADNANVRFRSGSAVSNPSSPSLHLALARSRVAADVFSGASWLASKAAFVPISRDHTGIVSCRRVYHFLRSTQW